MNKYISYCFALSGLLVSLSSCDDPRWDDNMEPTRVYMAMAGVNTQDLYTVTPTVDYSISVIKSSYFDEAATATVAIKSDEVDSYNTIYSESYKEMPTDCYTFETTTVSLSGTQQYEVLTVTVNVDNILALDDAATDYNEVADYVIPIGVTEASVEISELVEGATLLNFAVQAATVSLSTYGENTLPTVDSDTGLATINIDLSVAFENSWDLTCTLDFDGAFEALNETYGGILSQVSEDAVSVSANPVVIPAGSTSASLTVTIDTNLLGVANYGFAFDIESVSADGVTVIPNADRSSYSTTVLNAPIVYTGDYTDWVVDSYYTLETSEGSKDALLDGDLTTYFHSAWGYVDADSESTSTTAPSEDVPHWYVIDLGADYTITNILLAPRGASASYCNTGYFEVSQDKETWTYVGAYSIAVSLELQSFAITPTVGRYVKVYSTSYYIQQSGFAIQGGLYEEE